MDEGFHVTLENANHPPTDSCPHPGTEPRLFLLTRKQLLDATCLKRFLEVHVVKRRWTWKVVNVKKREKRVSYNESWLSVPFTSRCPVRKTMAVPTVFIFFFCFFESGSFVLKLRPKRGTHLGSHDDDVSIKLITFYFTIAYSVRSPPKYYYFRNKFLVR